MSDPIKDIIEKNLSLLVDGIEIKHTLLWEKLIESELYTHSDVQDIKVQYFLQPMVKIIILSYDYIK